MRRMLVSRSSFEKPRPLDRFVRTSSPSSTSAGRPRSASPADGRLAIAHLPAPARPGSQTPKPDRSSLNDSALPLGTHETVLGQVQAALLGVRLLPPPAARALVLAGLDGPRAGRAADGCVAALVQRVVVEPVLADVRPDLVPAPPHERGDLRDAAVGGVRLHHRRASPAGRLVPAQAGHPGVEALQGPGQGPYLAHVAAALAELHRAAEQVGAVRPDELRDLARIRDLDVQADRVPLLHAVDELLGLLGQPAGIERDHLGPVHDTGRHVYQHGRLGLEAGHDRHPAERAVGPPQDLLGAPVVLVVDDQLAGQRAHAVAPSAWNRSIRAPTPTRSHQSPNPSAAVRSAAKAASGPRRSPGISSMGTLWANSVFSRVPTKSPPRKTSYLPSVVPTKPTSPR